HYWPWNEGDSLDCCDIDNDAYPGQEDYFDHAVNCVGAGYDFNCDGSDTPLLTVTGSCTKVGPDECDTNLGWLQQSQPGGGANLFGYPACGADGTYLLECNFPDTDGLPGGTDLGSTLADECVPVSVEVNWPQLCN
ncbi:MAG: hypothetical protein QF464_05720, partial [Myxococcota bacterium]|nr:hypothetical protein [Myxococcota bacterium]